MYAIIETRGEDLEVEVLDESDGVRSPDGTVIDVWNLRGGQVRDTLAIG